MTAPAFRKWAIKALVVALLVALPLQAVYLKYRAEPWPALSMPRFQHVPHTTPYIYSTTGIVARSPDGQEFIVDVEDVLADMHPSLHATILRRHFGPNREYTAPDKREWLRNRLAEIYPEQEFESIEFRRYITARFGPGGESPEDARKYVVFLD